MYLIYSLLLSAAFLLMLPIFAIRRRKYLTGALERLGKYGAFVTDGRPVIWVHCVSVGEVKAALSLIKALRKESPASRIIVSVVTRTGREVAESVFQNLADRIFYFPLDFRFAVRSAFKTFKPSAVLLTETEIWPRFIYEARKLKIKIAVVNGRISRRSFRNYLSLGRLITGTFSSLDLALMQTEEDRQRITALGCREEKAFVTGNLKFDALHLQPNTQPAIEIRSSLEPDRPVIVAASTHYPEEAIFLDAVRPLVSRFATAARRPIIVIAPRHPERFEAVAELMQTFAAECGLYFKRRSLLPTSYASADLILLDTIGELAAIYPAAEIVFVGGSIIPHGGQNVLEPAAAGKPIITGPFTHNFDLVVKEMVAAEALIRIEPEHSEANYSTALRNAIESLLYSSHQAGSLGSNARK
ncbi:MAG: hypothetical protein C4325_04470, partial [Blastocatellia bacterium]